MVKQLTYLLILFVPKILFAQKNNDTIIFLSNSILLISNERTLFDTLNFVNENGLKQGLWIEYSADTVVTKTLTTKDYYTPELGIHGKSFITKSSRVEYNIKWSGLYIDNKKQGVWTNNLDKQRYFRKELIYKDNILQSLYAFQDNKLWIVADFDVQKSEWEIKPFDKNGKRGKTYYSSNLTFYLEM